jgi:uncharacterized peroxidase-related enzyme
MAFIATVPEERAEGSVARMYQALREGLGYVPNYGRSFSHRPALFSAWVALNSTVKGVMDPRRYELATLAAAVRRRSSYCTIAHGERLLDLGTSEDELCALAREPESAPLDETERAIFDFAAKVAEAAHTVTSEDVERLRSVGLTDAEIFDVASAAAARLFFTALCDAVGTRPDAAFRSRLPGLVEDLAVGRPVEEP